VLRAYLDGETDVRTAQAVDAHLRQCTRCQRRLADLRARAQASAERLAQLGPARWPEPSQALARLYAATGDNSAPYERTVQMETKRVWRTALIAVAIVGLVVGLASFAPARALAAQFLGIFRVQRFAAVAVPPGQAEIEQLSARLEQALVDYEPRVIVDEPVVDVSSIEQASEQAGFQVHMPSYLPFDGDPRIQVKGRIELASSIDRDALVMLLETAGMDSAAIAADWPGGEVRAIAPSTVSIDVGTEQVMSIVQVWKPEVQYPAGIEPSLVGEAALRLLGLPADQARRFSQSIDWTSTLLLPVPTRLASFRELEIAGQQAILLTASDPDIPDIGEQSAPDVLLWEKDDVLYAVIACANVEALARTAESMF
jgi:hypothetical protein